MKITRSFPVLILPFLLGSVAWSAPETTTLPTSEAVAKPFPKTGDENYALAKDLLTHSFDAYDAAKTFQGAFILTATKKEGRGKPEKTELRMRSSWRVNEQGDKVRESNFLVMSGRENGKPFVQNIRGIDNGEFEIEYVEEENKWSQTSREPVSAFRRLFRPIVDAVANNAINSPTVSLIVEQGVEGGVPIYIVRDKEQDSSGSFRVILNASDRSLRSLMFDTPGGGFDIRIFDRKFNEPLPESVFEWKAPVGSSQVPDGTLKPKMGIFGNSDAK